MKKAGDLKKVLNPLIKLDPYVRAIWVEDKEITVLLYDKIEDQKKVKKLQTTLDKFKGDYTFTKKNLTLWWEMVRHAEPKTLEQLKNMEIIYDKSDHVKLFKGMIQKGTLFASNKKADMLFERARNCLEGSEKILLNKVSNEVFMAMTEAAQALLLYLGKYSSMPEDVLKDLETYSKKTEYIRESLYTAYKEIHDECKGIREGKIMEFTAKDAGYFLSQAKNFMFEMEDMVTKFEKEKSERLMHEAYNFCLRLCEMALKHNMKVLPLRDDKKIEAFKKRYVDTGRVDMTHFHTLQALHDYNKANRKGKLSLMNDKTLDRIRIKNLGLAVQDVLRS